MCAIARSKFKVGHLDINSVMLCFELVKHISLCVHGHLLVVVWPEIAILFM